MNSIGGKVYPPLNYIMSQLINTVTDDTEIYKQLFEPVQYSMIDNGTLDETGYSIYNIHHCWTNI